MTQNQTENKAKPKKTDPTWNGRTKHTTPTGKELWLTAREKKNA